MRTGSTVRRAGLLLCAGCALLASTAAPAATFRVLAWNNLGMHCMDDSFAVFSLLPPFNTLDAQLVRDGQLVASDAGIVLSYRGVADPDGSINTSSAGKTDFWSFVGDLFGAALPVDAGLAGSDMPGAANAPQPLVFDAARKVWSATGIPITPYDDAGRKNPYPLVRVEARDAATDALLASSDVVLPVSDEMDCRGCHASGTSLAAKPTAGWVNDPDPARDHRLNILRLHDQRHGDEAEYAPLLVAQGYDAAGLYATVQNGGPAILCAACHASEALAAGGADGVSTLTRAMHLRHRRVRDPVDRLPLDDAANRGACYNCHPGSVTRCLRGAMGNAVAADGTLAMQCQSCHGSMLALGAQGRAGWLDEPACQNCHTGTATNNNGQIRYTDVYESPGVRRVPVDDTFATTPDAPFAPWSLYRYSTGHGGLACEACHDSTHAEAPSSHRNDNLKAIALQGHEGVLAECGACHAAGVPATVDGGPHGMHPIGDAWLEQHGDAAEHGGAAACQACHGADYLGSVLSRAQGDRTFRTDDFGTRTFWRGFQVSCFACHDGPNSESRTTNHPAQVGNASAETSADAAVEIALAASDADGDALVLRVVKQPPHGTVGVSGAVATYYPDGAFVGSEQFTFAAWDGKTDSNLGVASVTVPEAASGLAELAAAGALAVVTARRQRASTSSSRLPNGSST